MLSPRPLRAPLSLRSISEAYSSPAGGVLRAPGTSVRTWRTLPRPLLSVAAACGQVCPSHTAQPRLPVLAADPPRCVHDFRGPTQAGRDAPGKFTPNGLWGGSIVLACT